MLGVRPAHEMDVFDRDVIITRKIHESIVFTTILTSTTSRNFFVFRVENRGGITGAGIPRFADAINIRVPRFTRPVTSFRGRQRQNTVRPRHTTLEHEMIPRLMRIRRGKALHPRRTPPRLKLRQTTIRFTTVRIADIKGPVPWRDPVPWRARARPTLGRFAAPSHPVSGRSLSGAPDQPDAGCDDHHVQARTHRLSTSERARRCAFLRQAFFRRPPSSLSAIHVLAALDAATRAVVTAL